MTTVIENLETKLNSINAVQQAFCDGTLNKATGTEARVCRDIAVRQEKGLSKYGTTVSENDLTPKEWLNHLYEELLDAAVYCRRFMEGLD